jgi:hypothetical protein
MSISFRPATAAAGQLRTLDGDDTHELNVSNANGHELLLVLGLAPEPCGELPIATFRNLVTASLRRHLGRRSPARPGHVDSSGGATVIHPARREGYVEERLSDLARVAAAGQAAGATHLVWS